MFICICLLLCGCEQHQKVSSSFFIPDTTQETITEEVEDLALKNVQKLSAGEFLYEDICFEVDNVDNPQSEEQNLPPHVWQ